jgi:hypothetical protein
MENSDITLICRDLGRLEGRMTAAESRIGRIEEMMDMGFRDMGGRIDALGIEMRAESQKTRAAIDSLNLSRAAVHGGYWTVLRVAGWCGSTGLLGALVGWAAGH